MAHSLAANGHDALQFKRDKKKLLREFAQLEALDFS